MPLSFVSLLSSILLPETHYPFQNYLNDQQDHQVSCTKSVSYATSSSRSQESLVKGRILRTSSISSTSDMCWLIVRCRNEHIVDEWSLPQSDGRRCSCSTRYTASDADRQRRTPVACRQCEQTEQAWADTLQQFIQPDRPQARAYAPASSSTPSTSAQDYGPRYTMAPAPPPQSQFQTPIPGSSQSLGKRPADDMTPEPSGRGGFWTYRPPPQHASVTRQPSAPGGGLYLERRHQPPSYGSTPPPGPRVGPSAGVPPNRPHGNPPREPTSPELDAPRARQRWLRNIEHERSIRNIEREESGLPPEEPWTQAEIYEVWRESNHRRRGRRVVPTGFI